VAVLDTSAAVDYLLGADAAEEVAAILDESPGPSAPDVMVLEVLAVVRRHTLQGAIGAERARSAVRDLADMPIEWFPSMPLRLRAWALRENLGPADALFVALAEDLGERLVTKDGALASVAEALGVVRVQRLPHRAP
jgi:predicted nucleic acid-binding protein